VREVRAYPGVHAADAHANVIVFHTDDPERVNPGLVARLVSQGAEVISLEEDEVSLEDVYLSVVQQASDVQPSAA
jgi:hypothetical protein